MLLAVHGCMMDQSLLERHRPLDLRCEVRYVGVAAHTTDSLVVWVPKRSVLFSGDVLFNGGTPFVRGGGRCRGRWMPRRVYAGTAPGRSCPVTAGSAARRSLTRCSVTCNSSATWRAAARKRGCPRWTRPANPTSDPTASGWTGSGSSATCTGPTPSWPVLRRVRRSTPRPPFTLWSPATEGSHGDAWPDRVEPPCGRPVTGQMDNDRPVRQQVLPARQERQGGDHLRGQWVHVREHHQSGQDRRHPRRTVAGGDGRRGMPALRLLGPVHDRRWHGRTSHRPVHLARADRHGAETALLGLGEPPRHPIGDGIRGRRDGQERARVDEGLNPDLPM